MSQDVANFLYDPSEAEEPKKVIHYHIDETGKFECPHGSECNMQDMKWEKENGFIADE